MDQTIQSSDEKLTNTIIKMELEAQLTRFRKVLSSSIILEHFLPFDATKNATRFLREC